MKLPSMIEIEYFNVRSNILIKEPLGFKEFTIIPNQRTIPSFIKSVRVRLFMNKRTLALLEFLKKEKSTDVGFCLHLLAKSKLELFFYKVSLLFSSCIYINDPIYLKFSDSQQFYTIRTRNDYCLNPLKISDFEDIERLFVYQEIRMGLGKCLIETGALQRFNKIKQKHLHLCYLYFSSMNEQLDISLRLLSAWKYLEEYIELHGLNVPQNKIPKCIFQDIYQQSIIEKKTIIGLNEKTDKIWLHVDQYKEQFLRDFIMKFGI